VLTVADGEITAYRDYPNVSGAAAAMDIPSPARAVFDQFIAASVENRWTTSPICMRGRGHRDAFTRRRPAADEGPRRAPAPVPCAASVRRLVKADNVVVHETSDPAVLVAEFDLHQEMAAKPSSRRT